MKNLFLCSLLLVFTTACGKTEIEQSFLTKFSHIENSEILQRIETSIPEGININDVSEIKLGVVLSGKADSSKAVQIFMDNIFKKKIDTANLKSIKKDGKKTKSFELEVIKYPAKN